MLQVTFLQNTENSHENLCQGQGTFLSDFYWEPHPK